MGSDGLEALARLWKSPAGDLRLSSFSRSPAGSKLSSLPAATVILYTRAAAFVNSLWHFFEIFYFFVAIRGSLWYIQSVPTYKQPARARRKEHNVETTKKKEKPAPALRVVSEPCEINWDIVPASVKRSLAAALLADYKAMKAREKAEQEKGVENENERK